MVGNFWYYSFYFRNWWSDQKRQVRVYGWISFLPHRHTPHRIPAGDGAYCARCGTRNAVVQRRWRDGRTAGSSGRTR